MKRYQVKRIGDRVAVIDPAKNETVATFKDQIYRSAFAQAENYLSLIGAEGYHTPGFYGVFELPIAMRIKGGTINE